MFKPSLEENWTSICRLIGTYDDINIVQFAAMLERVHPQAISEGFFLLSAETPFLKAWAEREFVPAILRALSQLYDVPFSVKVEVDEPAYKASLDMHSMSIDIINESRRKTIEERKNNLKNIDEIPLNFTKSDSINTAGQLPFTESGQINQSINGNHNIPLKKENSPFDFIVNQEAINENDKNCNTDTSENFNHEELSIFEEMDPFNNPNSLEAKTFESYVIGDSNRLAYSMALQVAETPGQSALNPLFIYGKSGLGKTHLLYSIKNYIWKSGRKLNVVFTDAEALVSDYSNAVAESSYTKDSYKNFRKSYERADVLLIDDVQFLQGKKQTLDIVFQVFNNLINQGKQIVLSADRAPKNIDIDERYSSRFAQGGIIDIQPPEVETKLGIIKRYIHVYENTDKIKRGVISDDIQNYIAENSGSNIRELKGAISIILFRVTHGDEVSLTTVKTILEKNFSNAGSKNLSVEDIQREVEVFYKVSHKELVGKSREKRVVFPRHVAMYLCRQLLDNPHDYIGKKFNRDHSSVIHAVKKIEVEIDQKRDVLEEIESLKRTIKDV